MRAPTASVVVGRARQVRRGGGQVRALMQRQEMKIGVAMGHNERDRIVLVLLCGLFIALPERPCPDAVSLRACEAERGLVASGLVGTPQDRARL